MTRCRRVTFNSRRGDRGGFAPSREGWPALDTSRRAEDGTEPSAIPRGADHRLPEAMRGRSECGQRRRFRGGPPISRRTGGKAAILLAARIPTGPAAQVMENGMRSEIQSARRSTARRRAGRTGWPLPTSAKACWAWRELTARAKDFPAGLSRSGSSSRADGRTTTMPRAFLAPQWQCMRRPCDLVSLDVR